MRPLLSASALLVLATCATSPAAVAATKPAGAPGPTTLASRASPPIVTRRSAPVVSSSVATSPDPLAKVARANAEARVQPRLDRYANATQVYAFSEGAIYQVYTAPGRVTDIVLQPQEKLAGSGPVAAGDTVRWVIGDAESGSGPERRVHILVKPTRAGLATNLVINTDRRTYHLELRAAPATYMAAVSWRYPADEARAAAEAGRVAESRHLAEAEASAPAEPGLARLSFGYRIEGRAPWRPIRVYDDGRQTFVEFPPSIAQGEMPPLFVLGAGGEVELVNYRVQGRRMIVDRIFERAELRLGDRRGRQRVRLVRIGEGAS